MKMRHRHFSVFLKTSATVLLLAASGLIVAQDADPEDDTSENEFMLEEIIVTSRKLGAENLQDIPAAISVLDRKALEEGMVVDFEDFARQIPGLTFIDAAPGQKRYVIRGIQSSGQQQVAVYYDEVPLPGIQSASSNSGSQTTDLKLYDMERIEVLRGPQGTVFGANSQGGTVRFITRQPNLDNWEAYVSGEMSRTNYSSSNNWNYQAVMNVPMTETFGARILLYDGEDAGYIDNDRCRATNPAEDPREPTTQLSCMNLEDYNWAKTTGLRANLLWEASEKATFKAQFWWQDRNTGGDSRYHPFDAYNPNPTDPVYAGNHDSNVQPFTFFQEGKFRSGDYAQTPKPDEQRIYSLTGNFELPFADLTAIASRYERDFQYKFDSTWIIMFLLRNNFGNPPCTNPGVPGADPPGCLRSDLLFGLTDQTQSLVQDAFEFRFNSKKSDSPFQWVAGGFYRKRESTFHSYVPVINVEGLTFSDSSPPSLPPGSEIGAGVPGCDPCVFAREDNKDIEETAVFGEINWSITDAIDLNVGARYFKVKQAEAGRTVFQFAAFAPNPPDSTTPDGATPFVIGHLSDNELPWKVALAWHTSENVTLYALRANGFRLGGTNNSGIANIFIPEEFSSDELVNYEVGAKSLLANGRVTLNASAFLMEWDNLQVSGQDSTGAFGFIGNAGKAEVQGFELEFATAVSDSFDVSAQLTYLTKHELTEDQVTDTFNASGKKGDQLPRVPEMTGSFIAQYNYDLPVGGWNGAFRFEGYYTDKSFTELSPDNPNNRFQDSYAIFNARANFHNNGMDLDITLFVENIFDEDADLLIGTANGQPTSKVTNRPLTFGVQLTKRFGG
jgi:outer membrane receptor protein involved in Fe transport